MQLFPWFQAHLHDEERENVRKELAKNTTLTEKEVGILRLKVKAKRLKSGLFKQIWTWLAFIVMWKMLVSQKLLLNVHLIN